MAYPSNIYQLARRSRMLHWKFEVCLYATAFKYIEVYEFWVHQYNNVAWSALRAHKLIITYDIVGNRLKRMLVQLQNYPMLLPCLGWIEFQLSRKLNLIMNVIATCNILCACRFPLWLLMLVETRTFSKSWSFKKRYVMLQRALYPIQLA